MQRKDKVKDKVKLMVEVIIKEQIFHHDDLRPN